MVQFDILSGKKAGEVFVARRFPVRIGRAAAADLRLEEDGVWEQHAQIELDPAQGFILSAQPDALVGVNGQPVRQAVLCNGDALQLGSLKLQFWLGEARQSGLRLREALTWTAIGFISFGQIGLIYWLLK